jgi:hypothetical protein
MKKMLLVAVLIAGSATVAIVVARARSHRPVHVPPPTANPHARGIDHELAPLNAMLVAPVGATPCETAWNALSAGDAAGRQPGRTPLVLRLAPQAEFMKLCTALPAEARPCLAPAYQVHHREECLRARPNDDLIRAMFIIKPPEGVQAGERDADQQFSSTRKAGQSSASRPPAANMK